jgi:hypothetical protein
LISGVVPTSDELGTPVKRPVVVSNVPQLGLCDAQNVNSVRSSFVTVGVKS